MGMDELTPKRPYPEMEKFHSILPREDDDIHLNSEIKLMRNSSYSTYNNFTKNRDSKEDFQTLGKPIKNLIIIRERTKINSMIMDSFYR